MLAGRPDTPVELPDSLRRVIGTRSHEVVWRNVLGGLTVEVGVRPRSVHVKWVPWASGLDLERERTRLDWAGAFTAVPRVVEHGRDDAGQWLVTATIDARSAVDPVWQRDPRHTTRVLGEGLRRLHESLPVASCPFTWSLDERRDSARRRHRESALGVEWSEKLPGVALGDAFDALDALGSQARGDLVVCHGDACAPNTLIDAKGDFAGHVDLGALGVADRWADLAILAWSTEWNYGPGWESALYDAYGIAPDEQKVRTYRLLWELE